MLKYLLCVSQIVEIHFVVLGRPEEKAGSGREQFTRTRGVGQDSLHGGEQLGQLFTLHVVGTTVVYAVLNIVYKPAVNRVDFTPRSHIHSNGFDLDHFSQFGEYVRNRVCTVGIVG